MPANPDTILPESIRYRLDIVFAAAAITILAGLLIPIPLPAMDFAWICSVCLAAAVILVCAVAKSCHDLQGFGALLGILSLLRIGLIAVNVRKILRQQTSGVVVDLLGQTTLHTGVIAAAIFGILLILLGGWMVFFAAGRIRRSVQTYSKDILPVKRAGLQADISLQTISRDRARTVLEKIRSEMRFFGAIGAISVLMRCEALAGIVLILGALSVKALTDFMAAGYNLELIESLSSQTAGLAIIAVVPAVASAWSCVWLLAKDNLCLGSAPGSQNGKSEFITLPNTGSNDSDPIELLNPDFIEKAQQTQHLKEKIVDFEPAPPQTPTSRMPLAPIRSGAPQAYYQQLAEIVGRLAVVPGQAVLLASLPDVVLGVQAAVNTAVELSAKGRKTLLIDAQPQRSAVAKSFDLSRGATMTSPHKTVLENLSVFTAGDAESAAVKRTLAAIDQLHAKYEKIVIYAPAMAALFADKAPDRMHLLLFVKPVENSDSADVPESLTRCATLTLVPLL